MKVLGFDAAPPAPRRPGEHPALRLAIRERNRHTDRHGAPVPRRPRRLTDFERLRLRRAAETGDAALLRDVIAGGRP